MRAALALLCGAVLCLASCALAQSDTLSADALPVTVAAAALRGAATLAGEVALPALQLAARGGRGVNERVTYARYAARGPYAVGWRRLPSVPKTEGDWSWEVVSSLASRIPFQTTFPALLYYPAVFAGRNAPIAQGRTPFPIVGFAAGWTCDVAMYVRLLEHLASHGIVVAAPLFNDEAGQPLLQINFRSQLSQILSTVAYVGAQSDALGAAFGDLTTTGTWRGRVDTTRLGLLGHSAGGGVVLQGAAEQGARVRAVATLGAWVNVATTPWLASMPSAVTAPTMLLSGEWDVNAPLESNGQRVFDALTSPRLMPVIAGGSHCFLEWNAGASVVPAAGLLPWYGYSGCPAAQIAALPPPVGHGGIGMSDQVALAATHIATFFRLYLANDTDAAPLVWGDAMRNNSWMSSVQLAPGAELSVNASAVDAETGGGVLTVLANLTNLGVNAGEWALSATAFMPPADNTTAVPAPAPAPSDEPRLAELLRQQLAPAAPLPTASGLQLRLSQRTVAVPANEDATARQAAAAQLPRSPTLPLLLSMLRRSPPPPPPAPRAPAARRLLQQPPPLAVPLPAGAFVLEINTTLAQTGNHTVLLAARSLADDGTFVYARVTVRVPAGALAPATRDALLAQLGSPLVTAFAGRVASGLEQLAALAAASPPAVTALSGPTGDRAASPGPLASALPDLKGWASAAAAAAAAATQAVQQLSRAAAAVPAQPSPRDALQQLALQWVALLSGGSVDWSSLTVLSSMAGATLSSLRSSLLIAIGFSTYVPPPPSPPPPSPPPAPAPPPPTALVALRGLWREAGQLLRGAAG